MNVYPFSLGKICNPAVDRKDQRSLLGKQSAKSCPYLGEVYSAPIFGDDTVLVELERVCTRYGLCFNEQHPGPYVNHDYVFGAGSVGFHADDGMRLTAAVLVAVAPISAGIREVLYQGEPCCLIAGGKCLALEVGDAFVFNGDVEHAWMANCRWVIATQSVRKRKKGLIACSTSEKRV